MKRLAFALALLALVPARGAVAHGHDSHCPSISTSCCDPPTRWAHRHDPRDARLAITSENGDATLILTDEVAAIQLSDRALHRVYRQLRDDEEDDQDNAFASAIRTAVYSGVRVLLNHSAECPIRDLKDVEVRDGRLHFTTEDGGHIFESITFDDDDVMNAFAERDARAFAREFRRIKARTH
jgi:hypothetical protein